MDSIDQAPGIITGELEDAQAHLAQIQATLARFVVVDTGEAFRAVLHSQNGADEAYMLPAVPTEQLQARGEGQARYLYLLFRQDRRSGGYRGPDRARKIYVGCKAEAIARARQMAENRRRWEQLAATARRLEGWISATTARVQTTIQGLVEDSHGWPRAHLDELDPVAVGRSVDSGGSAKNP
jgi:hypothetical protein